MGALHYIVQTNPAVLFNGAAIAVKMNHWDPLLQAYENIADQDYVAVELIQPEFNIYNINASPVRFRDDNRAQGYFVIRSGGKSGYDFEGLFAHCRHCLQDATFYFYSEF